MILSIVAPRNAIGDPPSSFSLLSILSSLYVRIGTRKGEIPVWAGGIVFPVDKQIARGVWALNARGFPTTNSCAGAAIEDFLLEPRKHSFNAYISFRDEQGIPQDLMAVWQALGFQYEKPIMAIYGDLAGHPQFGVEWAPFVSPVFVATLDDWANNCLDLSCEKYFASLHDPYARAQYIHRLTNELVSRKQRKLRSLAFRLRAYYGIDEA